MKLRKIFQLSKYMRYGLLIFLLLILFSFIAAAQELRQNGEANGQEGRAGLVIGDSLPDWFWKQELKVINHPKAISTLKLSNFKDRLLVLDFLNTACAPCIRSVDTWNALQQDYPLAVQVLAVHLYGDNTLIAPFAERKGWSLPISVGNNADTLLNKLFYAKRSFGQVWVMDGKLLAIPKNKDVSRMLIDSALLREELGIEMNVRQTYFEIADAEQPKMEDS